MAIFDIDDFDNIEFRLPTKTSTPVVITLPPLDCVAPQDMEAVGKKIEEENPAQPSEIVRLFLMHFATTKEQRTAIDKLVTRQLVQLDKIWTRESGITVGESEHSTDSSSEETEK